MFLYSEYKLPLQLVLPNIPEALSPEEKAEQVFLLRERCFALSPSLLLRLAVMHDVVPELLKEAENIDDDKSKYILVSFKLISQLEEIIADDDGVKFSQFFTANPFFVMSFPLPELFKLLCRVGPSPACVKSLLNSSFKSHVDVNGFGLHRDSTPLIFAAERLCHPLTQTLLQFGANVHHNPKMLLTPLATAIESLSAKMNPTSREDIPSWFYKLSCANMREAVDTIRLLASTSFSVSAFNLDTVLKDIVFHHDWLRLALLLVVTMPLLMCPIDAWSVDNTPVSRFLACPNHAHQTRLNEARAIVASVWEASDKLCKMFFVFKLIPSSEIKEPFPGIMCDFFKQFIDAHTFLDGELDTKSVTKKEEKKIRRRSEDNTNYSEITISKQQ